MPLRVSPFDPLPTHHVELRSGSDKIGLILVDGAGNANPRAYVRSPYPSSALKIYTGDQKYSDSEPPFTPVSQSDFSGGRGWENLDEAANRYYDAWRADTIKDIGIILGGQHVYGFGHRGADRNWPYRNGTDPVAWSWVSLLSTTRYIGLSFSASSSYSAAYGAAVVRRVGSPGNLTMAIYSDSGGSPSSALVTKTKASADVEEYHSEEIYLKFGSPPSLTVTNGYWFVVYGASTDDADNYWQVLTVDAGSGVAKISTAGSSWGASTDRLMMRVTDAESSYHYRPFWVSYKGQLYVGQSTHLYMNGDRGLATAGGSTTLTDSGKSWTVDEWKGCIVQLTNGTGSDSFQNWRTITGNTANQLSVDSAWSQNPSVDTEYVILGSEKWTEVSGYTGGNITDMITVNGMIYIAPAGGDIVRLRQYNNTGTWTTTWTTETGSAARFLVLQPDGANKRIWKATTTNQQIAAANAVAEGGGTLTFGTAISVGDVVERITGLQVYGDDSALWVMKEGSLYEVKTSDGTNFYPYKFKLDEMGGVLDYRNGFAHLQHNVYLYFSLLGGLQRYYSMTVDNVGPDQDAGLPEDRQGNVSGLTGYPGRYIAVMDTGTTGRSSALLNNGQGWHEIFRSPAAGRRVRAAFVQSIPGNAVDRVWMDCGDDYLWIPISPNAYTHPQIDYGFYPYLWESSLITSWMYIQMQDTEKFWSSVKLTTENLSAVTGQTIEIDYQVDTDTTWTRMGVFTTSFHEEIEFAPITQDVTGRRLRLRLRLLTDVNNITPRLVAYVVEAFSVVIFKYQTTLTFRLMENETDLFGEADDISKERKIELLQEFAERAAPVKLYSVIPEFTDVWVKVQPGSFRVIGLLRMGEDNRDVQVCNLTLIEV